MSVELNNQSTRGAAPASSATLWSPALVATLGAQFLSALADNALIFAALALLRKDAYPAWTGPLLQEFFVGTYILLAPVVGVLADALPKSRVMLYANLVKCAGTLGLCVGVNPFLSYALVGCGAAAYSPAKYGILGELTAPEHLVKANGLLEAATIGAILLGAVAGGALTDWSVGGTLIAITACYLAAALGTLSIPGRRHPVHAAPRSLTAGIKNFRAHTRTLVAAADTRLALIGTGVFWGAGAALRFLVIAWVPVALHVTNNRLPGFLTGMVAAGIAVGAMLAGRFVVLHKAHRAVPAGILLGVGVCLLPLVHALPAAYCLMAFVGTSSGFLVVPLDALLQKRGEERVGVGSAIAIQNLVENIFMLVMMSAYTLAMFKNVPVNDIAFVFGLLIALSMALLTASRRSAR